MRQLANKCGRPFRWTFYEEAKFCPNLTLKIPWCPSSRSLRSFLGPWPSWPRIAWAVPPPCTHSPIRVALIIPYKWHPRPWHSPSRCAAQRPAWRAAQTESCRERRGAAGCGKLFALTCPGPAANPDPRVANGRTTRTSCRSPVQPAKFTPTTTGERGTRSAKVNNHQRQKHLHCGGEGHREREKGCVVQDTLVGMIIWNISTNTRLQLNGMSRGFGIVYMNYECGRNKGMCFYTSTEWDRNGCNCFHNSLPFRPCYLINEHIAFKVCVRWHSICLEWMEDVFTRSHV